MTPAPSHAVENAARLGRKGNMVAVEGNPRCRQHAWERRLEVHEGTECVVAVCTQCGTKELCWCHRQGRRRRRTCSAQNLRSEAEGFADRRARPSSEGR